MPDFDTKIRDLGLFNYLDVTLVSHFTVSLLNMLFHIIDQMLSAITSLTLYSTSSNCLGVGEFEIFWRHSNNHSAKN